MSTLLPTYLFKKSATYFFTKIQNNMNNKIALERLYTAIDKQGIISAHNYIRFLKTCKNFRTENKLNWLKSDVRGSRLRPWFVAEAFSFVLSKHWYKILVSTDL